MTTTSSLRARAQRFRILAERYDGSAAEHMREAAAQLERQADALDAYAAATRLIRDRGNALSA
ncbi:MAG TPA: hypothetical protein VMB81_10115 [Candidatus Sulfotelmatobacter sp.]|nr:hypothetical protein [Candidatus Sulfotelmatobacter sp.]